MADVVHAREVTVRRGRRTVLRDVTFALGRGEVAWLAGANGSGKTSLLRVLAGLAAPRGGTVEREGRWAFVPERVALAPALRCGEWLGAMRALRGLAAADWPAALAAGGLDSVVLVRPAGTLSKGMLQRLALLEALHAEAAILLLDEPYAGLDGAGRDWLAGALAAVGATVLFTDHSGAAAGRMAPDRALHLADGGCHEAAPPSGAGVAPDERTALVRAAHPDGRRLARRVPAADSDALLRELLAGGWHVDEVRP